jgi:hypothetical protein
MAALAKGIAHVSFLGGGAFLPLRNPDDRRTLIEYVADRVGATGQVQVLVGGQRWRVGPWDPSLNPCATCRHSLACRCLAVTDRGATSCLTRAFGNEDESAPRKEKRRIAAHRVWHVKQVGALPQTQ